MVVWGWGCGWGCGTETGVISKELAHKDVDNCSQRLLIFMLPAYC